MRAKNYVTWLELQQRWRDSDEVLTPSIELASELRRCSIDLLREVCADPNLEVPYEVLFQLSNELEALHAGSKATYLLPERFETNLKNEPTYRSLRDTAVGYIFSYPESDGRREAKKRVQKEFGIAQQTVSKWLTQSPRPSNTKGVSESLMRSAGSFYKTLRSEEKTRAKRRVERDLGFYHT